MQSLQKRKLSAIYSLVFWFQRLRIFLPFNSSDKKLKAEESTLPLNFLFAVQELTNQEEWGLGDMDMNSIN